MQRKIAFPLVGGVAGALLAIAAVAGVATAVDSSPAPQPSSPSAQAPQPDHGRLGKRHLGQHGFRGFGGQVQHGELVVKTRDGKTETVLVQTGTVTALSGSAMTVKSEDGFTQSWTLTGDTKMGKRCVQDCQPGTDLLKVGDQVRVAGPKSGDRATAQRVHAGAGR